VKGLYLGVQFDVLGKGHYGWAQFTIKCTSNYVWLRAVLTGYAYETRPDTSIMAGQTQTSEGFTRPPYARARPPTMQ
jgi:hypothetical protein